MLKIKINVTCSGVKYRGGPKVLEKKVQQFVNIQCSFVFVLHCLVSKVVSHFPLHTIHF